MNELDIKEVYERLARIDGKMENFLVAAANMQDASEKLNARVMAIELSIAQFRGQSSAIGRAFDIGLSVVMAAIGALAYKYLGA